MSANRPPPRNRPLSQIRPELLPELSRIWQASNKQLPPPPPSSLSELPVVKPLSDRQAACLYWSAEGKTSWETSCILGVSESTVNFHLRMACAKLGVRGRRAAVAAALRRGWLKGVMA